MALIVEDGTGLSTAESLVSVARADTILSKRVGTSTWTAMSTPQKEAALAHASRVLTRMDWNGSRVRDQQALAFPRTWLRKRDPVTSTPYLPGDPAYYAEDAVPDFAEEATSILAMRMHTRDPFARPDTVGVSSLQAGPLAISYDNETVDIDRDDPIDREVMDIIDFALRRSSNSIAVPAVRV